jgi:hypothetical protein
VPVARSHGELPHLPFDVVFELNEFALVGDQTQRLIELHAGGFPVALTEQTFHKERMCFRVARVPGRAPGGKTFRQARNGLLPKRANQDCSMPRNDGADRQRRRIELFCFTRLGSHLAELAESKIDFGIVGESGLRMKGCEPMKVESWIVEKG